MSLKSLAALVAAIVAAASPLTAQRPDSTTRRVAIKAGKLIDGRGGAPIANAVILIENDKITAVGQGLVIPRDAQVTLSTPTSSTRSDALTTVLSRLASQRNHGSGR